MSEHLPQIAPPSSRRTPLLIGAAVVVVLAVVAAVFLARGDDAGAAADGTQPRKVVLGTVGASDPYWQVFADAAAEKGIDLEVRDFADYTQPNPALAEGELDVNQFQHLVYLAEYNTANDGDIVPLGSTAIYPLGLYSQQYDSVDEIQDGDTVVVPDDDSNQARGLLILQSAGLITLKDGGSIYSTLADIDQDASRVEVKAIKADLTPTSLPDVAAAIVNNDFVEKAGLEFEDALATDDASDPNALPYVNVFAVRAEDRDDPTLLELVEIYQDTQAVLDGVQDVSGGTAELVKVPQDELQTALDKVEADTLAQQ